MVVSDTTAFVLYKCCYTMKVWGISRKVLFYKHLNKERVSIVIVVIVQHDSETLGDKFWCILFGTIKKIIILDISNVWLSKFFMHPGVTCNMGE